MKRLGPVSRPGSASAGASSTGRYSSLQLVLAGRLVSADEPQTVPPSFKFSLCYLIPAMPGGGTAGVPAGQFLHTFGTSISMFGMIPIRCSRGQLARLDREIGNVLPALPGRKP
jgi:hypothetical protein